MLHFCKLISIFYHDHPKKLTATFLPIDFTLSTAKPIIKLTKASSINKWLANKPKPMTLGSTLKKTELHFYFIFDPVSITGKRALGCIAFTLAHSLNFLFSSTFWFFFLGISQEVLSIYHLIFLFFFYQSLREFESFLSIDPPVFFFHLLSRFWRFFIYTIVISKLITITTFIFVGAYIIKER